MPGGRHRKPTLLGGDNDRGRLVRKSGLSTRVLVSRSRVPDMRQRPERPKPLDQSQSAPDPDALPKRKERRLAEVALQRERYESKIKGLSAAQPNDLGSLGSRDSHKPHVGHHRDVVPLGEDLDMQHEELSLSNDESHPFITYPDAVGSIHGPGIAMKLELERNENAIITADTASLSGECSTGTSSMIN